MYECSLHVARCGTSQIQIVTFYETDLHKTFREIELEAEMTLFHTPLGRGRQQQQEKQSSH